MATFPAKTNYAAGNVLTAAQMVDIGEQINALNGNAGKNKIINGDFLINQRNFSSETASAVYIFDRWRTGTVGGTSTFSAQTFTLGAAPVSGYEGRNFLRIASTGQSAAGDLTQVVQRIESVRTFAGQTVTVSFWAKASSGTPSIAVDWLQYFGTGGSPSSAVSTSGQKATLSTSWARYSFTFAISSISSKTIGTDNNDSLWLRIWTSAGSTYNTETNTIGIQTATIDVWGFQMEAGSVATSFQTATGTLAGELAACQRYYWRITNTEANFPNLGSGYGETTTAVVIVVQNPVPMRVKPTSFDSSGIVVYDGASAPTISTVELNSAGILQSRMKYTVTGATQYRPYIAYFNGANTFFGLNAEL